MSDPVYHTYEDFPLDKLQLYAGFDCITTSEVLRKLFPIITKETPYKYTDGKKKINGFAPMIIESSEDLEIKALEFIIDMEINGIHYDVQRNYEIRERMHNELAELEDKIFTAIGNPIDLNSGTKMAYFLYQEKGLTPPYYTKKNEPAVDGDALLALASSSGLEYLAWIAKRNDINSACNTFVENYVRDFVKRDGKIHPSYNLHGTSSFRITGDSPNLTQLPRPKHGYNIREMFKVAEGNCFITLDFSSAEVKVLGALCKDPLLIQAIKEGKDFHSFSASMMRHIDYDEFVAVVGDKKHPNHKQYKQWRQEAKALTFGILYGSTARGIAFNLGLTEEEGTKLINMYFSLFPLIKKYIEDTHAMAKDNFFVTTPFGRRKMEFGAMEIFKGTAAYNAALRNGQNVRIQSTSSDIGLFCFSTLNEAVKRVGGKCICTVYDSIEIEAPISKAAEIVELGFYYMNDYPQEVFDWLTFEIGAEAEVGFNWGELSVVHRGVTQDEINALLLTS